MKLIKRNDLILLSILLLVGILGMLLCYAPLDHTGTTVIVTVDGTVTHRLPLNENTELLIEGYHGGTNLLIIKDGHAYISDATCPDRVCVNMGEVTDLKSVICAPNRVVISIEKE